MNISQIFSFEEKILSKIKKTNKKQQHTTGESEQKRDRERERKRLAIRQRRRRREQIRRRRRKANKLNCVN